MTFKEQRRYPRASVPAGLAEVIQVLGAHVGWPNLEISDVLDLSYRGLAARRPGLFPIAVQETADLRVHLGLLPPFSVRARIAWGNLDWVGLEFLTLPPEGHRAMTEFLDAQLIGCALRPIERAFFAPEQNFTHWFQGPGGVHVFVWLDDGARIERVSVDWGASPIEFSRAAGAHAGASVNWSAEQRKALLILSQMDKPGFPMEEFVRTLALGV
jgi:hypothetical protein